MLKTRTKAVFCMVLSTFWKLLGEGEAKAPVGPGDTDIIIIAVCLIIG